MAINTEIKFGDWVFTMYFSGDLHDPRAEDYRLVLRKDTKNNPTPIIYPFIIAERLSENENFNEIPGAGVKDYPNLKKIFTCFLTQVGNSVLNIEE